MSRFDEAQEYDEDIIVIPDISEALIIGDKDFKRGNRKFKETPRDKKSNAAVAREAFRASRSHGRLKMILVEDELSSLRSGSFEAMFIH